MDVAGTSYLPQAVLLAEPTGVCNERIQLHWAYMNETLVKVLSISLPLVLRWRNWICLYIRRLKKNFLNTDQFTSVHFLELFIHAIRRYSRKNTSTSLEETNWAILLCCFTLNAFYAVNFPHTKSEWGLVCNPSPGDFALGKKTIVSCPGWFTCPCKLPCFFPAPEPTTNA